MKLQLFDSVFSIDIDNVNIVVNDDVKEKLHNFLYNKSTTVINKFIKYIYSDVISDIIDIDAVIDSIIHSIMISYNKYDKYYESCNDIEKREKCIYDSLKKESYYIVASINKIMILLHHFKMENGHFILHLTHKMNLLNIFLIWLSMENYHWIFH